jgi:hypothetical protein
MPEQFSKAECDTIVEALKHYKLHVENYDGYSSYAFKQEQLQRIEVATEKMRVLGSCAQ